MTLATDQAYLLQQQYQNAANLSARINLHARFSVNSYGWHRWVFDQFEPVPQCRVLELGCGSGMLWLKNQSRLPEDWDIMLSDFSPGMLVDARRNLASVAYPFAFRQVDACSIPVPDAGVDMVIANHMLYHVPDRAAAFAEIRRVLKPGGHLYAATNGQDHLRELSQLQERFDIPDLVGTLSREFSLEDGGEQLAPSFAHISLRHYEDALVVTEAEPLIAFILSQSHAPYNDDARILALRTFIADELAQKGAIRITKSTGMFVATREAK
jgi:ubiquinone/menaquinone biosynthesis C-methylase UbiE